MTSTLQTTSRAASRILTTRLCACAMLFLLAIGSPAFAQTTLTWDPNGAAAGTGGAGTWNTTNARWFDGSVYTPWSAVTFDNAIFSGTAGTVTLGVPVGAQNLTFSTDRLHRDREHADARRNNADH